MKKLMNIIMLSCKKATLLIEKSHSSPLSFTEKVKLKLHLSMCDKCTDYKKQSILIDNALKANRKHITNPLDLKLSENTKAMIQKALDEKLKN